MHENNNQQPYAPVSATKHVNSAPTPVVGEIASETRAQGRHGRRRLRNRDVITLKRWQLNLIIAGTIGATYAVTAIVT